MQTRNISLVALFIANAMTTSAETPIDSAWPQWRGPNRDGQFPGSAWPEKLDTNRLQRAWRVELGPSYSGPIVVGDRVFTTESKDKKFEIVIAFDRKTGKELDVKVTDGGVTVDNAKVLKTDVAASNGVIHVIDSVVLPK